MYHTELALHGVLGDPRCEAYIALYIKGLYETSSNERKTYYKDVIKFHYRSESIARCNRTIVHSISGYHICPQLSYNLVSPALSLHVPTFTVPTLSHPS
jgi:hypothetical protein